MRINNMPNEEVMMELKKKNLPTFGTAQERRDRLKKSHAISPTGGPMDINMGGYEAPIEAVEKPIIQQKGKKLSVLDNI